MIKCNTLIVPAALVAFLALPAIAQDTNTPVGTQETITVNKDEFEALKNRLEQVEQQLQDMQGTSASTQPATALPETQSAEPSEEATPSAQTEGGRHLALPDISLIVEVTGKLSTDERDEDRNSVRVNEAEIGIQGYVYPDVKADAFFSTSPQEGVAMQVEEAYLTYLGFENGLTGYVGEKHVPFGRTNLLHRHSLPYARQPLVLQNLVAEESLIGEGLQASYLLPTGSNLFVEIDLGAWTKSGHSHDHEEHDDDEEDGDFPEIVTGEGAGFTGHFETARLWSSYPVSRNSELELGTSYANGDSHGFSLGVPSVATLTGIDLSYRLFGEGDRRLLFRGEAVKRREKAASISSSAHGYYLFSNYRTSKYSSFGALYDWSEFPQDPTLHESAFSLIWTRQFSEQYYIRLQGTHGNRPGVDSYDELWVQWVWGVGPHSHVLE